MSLFLLVLLLTLPSICRAHIHPWQRLEKVGETNDRHLIVLGMTMQNSAELERLFYAVSDPESDMYGQFLTLEEVAALTVDESKTEIVRSFLLQAGIPQEHMTFSPHHSWLFIETFRHHYESVFEASFSAFQHAETNAIIYRSETFELPVPLRDYVDSHFFTTDFPQGFRIKGVKRPLEGSETWRKNNPWDISSHFQTRMGEEEEGEEWSGFEHTYAYDDAIVTTKTIYDYYNIQHNSRIHDKSSMSAFETCGQMFSQEDLEIFCHAFGVSNQEVSHIIGLEDFYHPLSSAGDDCTTTPDLCLEGNLDVQYMLGLAYDVPMTYWKIASGSQDPFLSWLLDLSGVEDPPLVHSISYGYIEAEITEEVMRRTNAEFMKAALRGLTIIVSSGDDGVANVGARTDASFCGFNPTWPASSPYVTTVGATQFSRGSEKPCTVEQKPAASITSGGGFSAVHPRPNYQANQVENYLRNTNLPDVPFSAKDYPSEGFNKAGRGYPDISAVGHNVVVVIGGRMWMVDGTSASTPIIASMVALINNERLNNYRTPLGFINPLLYGASYVPGLFHSVSGRETNRCTAKVCCDHGFEATEGMWNPLTGLGTPDYQRLLEIALHSGK